MKKWIIAVAALTLAANAAALAQSGRNKGSSSSSSTTDSMSNNRPMMDAPVGHRQPRASDFTDEKNLSNPSDPMNKEDAALDRKIKSICRGC
jgi:hypothetical protein